jgi:uncharacterized membrane protein YfcA
VTNDGALNFFEYLSLALIFLFAASVQAAIGFGAGLFAIPLVVLLGKSLPEAVGMTLPVVLMQTGFNIWQLRRQFQWRHAAAVSIFRIVSLPLGTWIMFQLANAHASLARRAIGVVILVILAAQTWFRVEPRGQVRWWWTATTGVLSGVLAGAIGMGGPLVVLWVMAHDWPPLRQRMCLWTAMIAIMPAQIPLLCLVFGNPLRHALLLGVTLAPAAIAGAWLGGRVGNRMSRRRLRRAMITVLIAIAVYSILGQR